jgi:hypothetical protein
LTGKGLFEDLRRARTAAAEKGTPRLEDGEVG